MPMDHASDESNQPEDLRDALMSQATSTGKREISEEEQELWQSHFDGDASARNALVEKFFPLVDVNAKNVVETILKAIEESDFHQAGVIGFMESIDEYRSNQHTSFEEFSSLKIRAAILEELANFIRE